MPRLITSDASSGGGATCMYWHSPKHPQRLTHQATQKFLQASLNLQDLPTFSTTTGLLIMLPTQ